MAHSEIQEIANPDELDDGERQDGLGDDGAQPDCHEGQLEQEPQFLADDAPVRPPEAVSHTRCHRLERPGARRECNRNRCAEEAEPKVRVARDGVHRGHHTRKIGRHPRDVQRQIETALQLGDRGVVVHQLDPAGTAEVDERHGRFADAGDLLDAAKAVLVVGDAITRLQHQQRAFPGR